MGKCKVLFNFQFILIIIYDILYFSSDYYYSQLSDADFGTIGFIR